MTVNGKVGRRRGKREEGDKEPVIKHQIQAGCQATLKIAASVPVERHGHGTKYLT